MITYLDFSINVILLIIVNTHLWNAARQNPVKLKEYTAMLNIL